MSRMITSTSALSMTSRAVTSTTSLASFAPGVSKISKLTPLRRSRSRGTRARSLYWVSMPAPPRICVFSSRTLEYTRSVPTARSVPSLAVYSEGCSAASSCSVLMTAAVSGRTSSGYRGHSNRLFKNVDLPVFIIPTTHTEKHFARVRLSTCASSCSAASPGPNKLSSASFTLDTALCAFDRRSCSAVDMWFVCCSAQRSPSSYTGAIIANQAWLNNHTLRSRLCRFLCQAKPLHLWLSSPAAV
mmetsp:Transcript_9130/g.24066  ORF Transcript_9130/g.24066 Transcript_9130/m.24066 type:complete len:244 (-) Transcript_9130:13-744(-)